MAFQTPITIRQALSSIERSEYALPAIQRNFVWDHQQIAKLFDSLMREYPIGSFLFWRVGRDDISQWQFYEFMLHYHQRDNRRPPVLGAITRDEITAVLDGQRRLTGSTSACGAVTPTSCRDYGGPARTPSRSGICT